MMKSEESDWAEQFQKYLEGGGRFPNWSSEDLNILASLFVNAMIVIAEAIEDAHDQAALDEIKRVAVKQLRMIVVGVAGWRSTV